MNQGFPHATPLTDISLHSLKFYIITLFLFGFIHPTLLFWGPWTLFHLPVVYLFKMLNDIPLYIYIWHNLFLHGHLSCFNLELLQIQLLWTSVDSSLIRNSLYFSMSWRKFVELVLFFHICTYYNIPVKPLALCLLWGQ